MSADNLEIQCPSYRRILVRRLLDPLLCALPRSVSRVQLHSRQYRVARVALCASTHVLGRELVLQLGS